MFQSHVLLTGGTGYIGSHTAVTLIEAGYQVVLLDNLCNSQADMVDRIAALSGARPVFVEGDVRDTALVRDTLERHSIEAVIHFAGLKAVGESVERPIDYYANNVQGSINLLQAMQAAGVHRLVFSSSATVYGTPHYLPYDEQHPTAAINPYGRTKLQVEEFLHDVAASSADWRFATLRYFNPVGAHPSGLIGEAPNGIPNNLMPYIAQVAVGTRPWLNVFGDDYDTPDGTGVRDYIHVMDLAEGHLAALRFLQEHAGWHAFNLGTGQGTSVLDMVRTFESASGVPVPYHIAPRRDGDLPAYYAKADKAREQLGWQAHRTLHDMCASTWRWQQNFSRQS
jgi:UDP-glucose 4-epimerase